MKVKPLHNTRSLQWTRNGLTQTKHLRRSPCKSDHELLQENSKVAIGQISVQDSSIVGVVEDQNVDRSKP